VGRKLSTQAWASIIKIAKFLHKIVVEHDENLKTTFEMMLKNECSCTFPEMLFFFCKGFVFLFDSYSNDGMKV